MKYLIIFLLLFTSTLAGCNASDSAKSVQDNGKLQVYTTVYPLEYFTEQIGGQYVEVNSIYPAGGDEHSYEPTQKETIAIADADMFFYIGYGLEGFVPKMEQSLESEHVEFLAVGEQIKVPDIKSNQEHIDEPGDEEHEFSEKNPHIWLDPIYCIDMAKIITDQLTEKMPEHQEEFQKNFESLSARLNALNDKFIAVASAAPQKEFLVSHAAFSYWEDRYGIKQIPIAGLSSSDEPSQKQIKEIIDTINAHDLKYVLVEQNISPKYAETIQAETGVELLPIHNLAVLTQEDIDHGEDYFTIAEKNIQTLSKALANK